MGESGLKECSGVERSWAGWRCSGNTGCNTDRVGMHCIAGGEMMHEHTYTCSRANLISCACAFSQGAFPNDAIYNSLIAVL